MGRGFYKLLLGTSRPFVCCGRWCCREFSRAGCSCPVPDCLFSALTSPWSRFCAALASGALVTDTVWFLAGAGLCPTSLPVALCVPPLCAGLLDTRGHPALCLVSMPLTGTDALQNWEPVPAWGCWCESQVPSGGAAGRDGSAWPCLMLLCGQSRACSGTVSPSCSPGRLLSSSGCLAWVLLSLSWPLRVTWAWDWSTSCWGQFCMVRVGSVCVGARCCPCPGTLVSCQRTPHDALMSRVLVIWSSCTGGGPHQLLFL